MRVSGHEVAKLRIVRRMFKGELAKERTIKIKNINNRAET